MTRSNHRPRALQNLPSAFFMTDGKRCPDPGVVIGTLPTDCAVIFREYKAPNREELAHELAELCHRNGLLFLVAADARLAYRVGADGLHLPEWSLSHLPVASEIKKKWLITASAHSVSAMRRAQLHGADAALLAPAFATESHPDKAGLGVHRFQRLASFSPIPLYALGGLSAAKLKRLPPMGNMAGFAGISIFMKKMV